MAAAAKPADRKHLFWQPGSQRPAVSGALDRAREGEHGTFYNPRTGLSLTQQRLALPVFALRRELLYMVETHATTIVVGHTGCGKTTQIPQYLHEAGWTAGGRLVACTQPRRVAAISVAERVADEMGEAVGEGAVGYAVRFDVRVHPERTRVKYMTDGALVREMLQDPLLSRYAVIMVDEAHERGVTTDMCLALLKKVQRRRRELRLIIASATLDAEELAEFYGGTRAPAPAGAGRVPPVGILSVSGARAHAVHRCYLSAPCADYVTEAVRTVLAIHEEQPGGGDVLVFLTGQQEIDAAARMLADAQHARETHASERALRPAVEKPAGRGGCGGRDGGRGAGALGLAVVPLHGGLSRDAQLAAFAPAPRGSRKVVLATNIAETSVTIDGIVFVVDSGFVKQQVFDVRSGREALVVAPISRAAAKQRAGRAGRTRAGVCYHLYTRGAHDGLAAATAPDVQRCALEGLVLQLKALGVDNVARFELPTPPPAAHLAVALELLYALGAIDDAGRLTAPLGERMAELPTSPMLSCALLGAEAEGCAREALDVAALVSVQSVWAAGTQRAQERARAHFAVYEGDHVTLANVLRAWERRGRAPRWAARRGLDAHVLARATHVRAQLERFLKRFGVARESCGSDTDRLRRTIVRGFFPHAARRHTDNSYRDVRSARRLVIHPRSVLHRAPPEWVVFHEVQTLTTGDEAMVDVCKIEPEWLTEIAPQFYEVRRGGGGSGHKRPRGAAAADDDAGDD